MQHFLDAFSRYADFHGRSTRTQYWMFVLFNIIFTIVAAIIDSILFNTPFGIVYLLYALVLLIPSLAVAVRRLHDSGRSGYMLLVGLIPLVGGIWLLVLLLAPSEEADSVYGDYNSDVLDSPMPVLDVDQNKADNAIIVFLCWVLFTTLFWRIAPSLDVFNFQDTAYMIYLILQTLIGGVLSVNLALALKEGSKRMAGIIIASILLLFDLFRIYEIYQQFN